MDLVQTAPWWSELGGVTKRNTDKLHVSSCQVAWPGGYEL